MGNRWRESTWGDEISLEYGKRLQGYKDDVGRYPVYGANGLVGWTKKFLAPGPGVILGRKGANRGVEFSKTPFFVIDTAYYVKPKTELDMRWLYYAIKHYNLGEINDGSPIPSTTRSAVYVSKLQLPDLPEQKAIAYILGSLDDKIELNRRMNETLEAMAQALFKSWFVDFDPVIDNALAAGNVIPEELRGRAEVRRLRAEETNSTLGSGGASFQNLFPACFEYTNEMGWIPAGWKVSQIKKIAKIANGKTSPERDIGNIPVFGSNGCIGFSNKYNRDNVIIIGRVGTYCGSLHYCRTLCWVTDNAMTAEMYNKKNNIYLLELLKQSNLNEKKGGSGQPLLNQTIIGLTKFIKPLDKVIAQFSNFSVEFYRKIDFNEQIISNVSNIRDSLLPQLLSGIIRVPEAEKLVDDLDRNGDSNGKS